MEYEPPVINPVDGSIEAPSEGESTKENVPPNTPKIVAVAPSQVAVNSNNELSGLPKFNNKSSETIQSWSKTSTL